MVVFDVLGSIEVRFDLVVGLLIDIMVPIAGCRWSLPGSGSYVRKVPALSWIIELSPARGNRRFWSGTVRTAGPPEVQLGSLFIILLYSDVWRLKRYRRGCFNPAISQVAPIWDIT